MKLKYLILLLFITPWYGCKDISRPSAVPVEKPHHYPKKDILLYIDLTGSMKENGVDKVIGKAVKIYQSLPPDSRMTVKLNDLHPEEENVCIARTPKLKKNIPSHIKAYQDLMASHAQDLRSSIQARYDQLSSGSANTCILQTFEHARMHFFAAKDPEAEHHLIYLSDMVEQCNPRWHSGGVDILHAHGERLQELTESARQMVVDQQKPLKDSFKNNIHIVMTSSGVTMGNDQSAITHDQVVEFWREVFMAMGYGREEIDQNFNLITDIPAEFTGMYPDNI